MRWIFAGAAHFFEGIAAASLAASRLAHRLARYCLCRAAEINGRL